jgi:predicted  nucleic acid-binding Zn-ribbon protein
MPMPALKIEPEPPVQERTARLEANVEHMMKDTSDIKTDIRRVNDRIDAVDKKFTDKFERIKKNADGSEHRALDRQALVYRSVGRAAGGNGARVKVDLMG